MLMLYGRNITDENFTTGGADAAGARLAHALPGPW